MAAADPGVLERWGRLLARRRWRVLALWLVGLAVVVGAARAAGEEPGTSFEVPGTESQAAFDRLRDRFPELSGDTVDIVVRAERTVDDPAARSRVEAFFEQVGSLPHVVDVASFYEPDAVTISQDRRIGLATVQFDVRGTELRDTVVPTLLDLRDDASSDRAQIELGGRVIQFAEIEGPGGRAEIVGLSVATVVLLVSFGSVIAMGVPLLTALFSLGVTLSALALLAGVLDITDFGPRLAALIGLGVGIDYALFMVTRFREELHKGLEPEAAVGAAMASAGKAVLFAGATVVISLGGMLVMGVPVVRSLAIGAAVAVVTAMAATLTLVPAVLRFAGRGIDRLRVPFFHRDETRHRASGWFRWSRLVQHRPLPFALLATALLVVLALPVFSIRLGSADAGSDPTTKTSRRAYDLLTEAFGPGFNGPLLLVAELRGPGAIGQLDAIADRVGREDGVAFVSPAQLNESRDTAVVIVFPTTSPQDERTLELIQRLRHDVLPDATAGTDVEVLVGGITAVFEDLGTALADRLPLFVAVVIGLSFLLLMAVFRSLLIPLKAAVMNLLSIGAAYGVIVAVFQWGWLNGVLGLDGTGPIQSFIPMLLFAVLFGLSMDYEVFLLSRVREEYLRTGDNGLAVADGLAATARVITAAAAIMVAVFGSALLAEDRTTKLFGLGLATAIFIDATIVRTMLVPATMELLGRANWWLPRWLDRVLPRVSIDTAAPVPDEEQSERAEPDRVTVGAGGPRGAS